MYGVPGATLVNDPLTIVNAMFQREHALTGAKTTINNMLVLPVLFLIVLPKLIFKSLSRGAKTLADGAMVDRGVQTSGRTVIRILRRDRSTLLTGVGTRVTELPRKSATSVDSPCTSDVVMGTGRLVTRFYTDRSSCGGVGVDGLGDLVQRGRSKLFSCSIASRATAIRIPTRRRGTPPEGIAFAHRACAIDCTKSTCFTSRIFRLASGRGGATSDCIRGLAVFFNNSTSNLTVTMNIDSRILTCQTAVRRITRGCNVRTCIRLLVTIVVRRDNKHKDSPVRTTRNNFGGGCPRIPGNVASPTCSVRYKVRRLGCTLSGTKYAKPASLSHVGLTLRNCGCNSNCVS